MTECERLIAEGRIPASFIEPEVRECQVTAELKKIWALQIDMLQQVERICKAHSLQYFAICGTALGAFRHHGFIPWDDDVDIALKRSDYNAFLKYAQSELSEPYYLQAAGSDPLFYRSFAVMRNSNSTSISAGDECLQCNNGVMIHIFPLDGYTGSWREKLFLKVEHIRSAVATNKYHPIGTGKKKLILWAEKVLSPIILFGGIRRYALRHEKICTKISEKEHERIGTQFAHFVNLNKVIWKKEWFDSAVMMPFEFTQIPMPIGYEEMLWTSYKNPTEMPPKEKRVYRHSWEMDPDTPYKQYCSEKYGVKY